VATSFSRPSKEATRAWIPSATSKTQQSGILRLVLARSCASLTARSIEQLGVAEHQVVEPDRGPSPLLRRRGRQVLGQIGHGASRAGRRAGADALRVSSIVSLPRVGRHTPQPPRPEGASAEAWPYGARLLADGHGHRKVVEAGRPERLNLSTFHHLWATRAHIGRRSLPHRCG
jgi:hypothetical protein